MDNYTHAETWLQLKVPNLEESTNYPQAKYVETCDELDELPKNIYWIQNPAGTVFNVQERLSIGI